MKNKSKKTELNGKNHRADDVLLFLAQTSSGTSKEPFFNALARYLASSLKMDFVCIDRLEKDGLRATTVAVWCDGIFQDNISYTLADTPCGEVLSNRVCCYPAKVAKDFPKDQVLQELNAESYAGVTVFGFSGQPIGLIATIGRKPLVDVQLAQDTLKMVSIRVAGELERMEAMEALRESEERFKALHNASFGGIAIHDQGTILDCNQGLSDMMGYSREELIGMNGYLLVAPDYRQLILDNVEADYEKPYEAYGMRKNGEIFPMRLEARVIPYKGKKVRTVEFRDLTEQKRAEKMLMERDADLKEAQQIARLGSWRLDLATNEVQWSEELYKIYGFDPAKDPPPYTEHQKLFTPSSWELLSASLANTASTGIPYELELETVLKDGNTGWMWAHGEVVRNDAGEIIGLRGAAQDITERKMAEQEQALLQDQLNQSHKMELLGQLAGTVAHDFNNLLTVIMGYSADLCNGNTSLEQVKQDAEEIFNASVRAKELTQQLLTYSRKQVVLPKALNINELIPSLQGVFQRLIGPHIKISHNLCSENAIVFADAGQMEQVIINLLLNSRDAMPNGGEINITSSVILKNDPASEHGYHTNLRKYVQIAVSDTGHGIPKDLQHRLFEPFFTTKEKGKGLGLGLPNILNIIKNAGGSINVNSEAGQGATFEILLPYYENLQESEAPEQHSESSQGNLERILIVDDEEALAGYFQKMVSRFGYEVHTAYSGAEALLKLENGLKPALVISDIIMPGMNGRELAEKIQQKNPKQKIIFMSGFTDDILQPIGIVGHEIPFIQKPFTAKQLATLINGSLK